MATQGNVRVPFFSLRSRRLYVMSTRALEKSLLRAPIPLTCYLLTPATNAIFL